MNENNIEEPDAHKSKCWDCKFGICIRESEVEKVVHPAIGPSEPQDLFEPDQNQGLDVVEHIFEHRRTKTVCFWKSENVTSAIPLLFGKVEQCNRYEKNN